MPLPPANLPAALMELTPPLLQLATQALDLVLDFNRPADAVLSAFFPSRCRTVGVFPRA